MCIPNPTIALTADTDTGPAKPPISAKFANTTIRHPAAVAVVANTHSCTAVSTCSSFSTDPPIRYPVAGSLASYSSSFLAVLAIYTLAANPPAMSSGLMDLRWLTGARRHVRISLQEDTDG